MVSFDVDRSTYDLHEHQGTTSASVDGGGLHVEKGGFSGKTTGEGFSRTFGGVNETEDGVSVARVVHPFSTATT